MKNWDASHFLVAFLVMLVFCNFCYADGNPSLLSLVINPSAGAAGMGGAYAGVAEGIAGLYYNPAGIVLNNQPEVGLLYTNYTIDTTVTEAEVIYEMHTIGFIYPFKSNKYGLGFMFRAFTVPEIQGYNEYGIATADVSQENQTFSLVGSARISSKFSLGATLKFVAASIYGEGIEYGPFKDSTLTFDTGLLYESTSKRFSAGLALHNAGGSIKYKYIEENLPSGFRTGIAYRLLRDKNLLLAADFNNVFELSDSHSLDFGGEWNYHNWLFLRTGISAKPGISSLNFGFGIKFKNFVFDYCGSPAGDFSTFHRVDLSYKFGRGEEKPKPAEKPKAVEKPVEKPVIVPPGEKINIAVADFAGKNVSAADASIVADFLRTELVNTQVFNVMDRANMEAILSEQKFQLSGCTTEECAVKMGKLLNVQQMVVGSLSKLLDTYYITVNLVDVETGKIIKAEKAEATSARELSDACGVLANRLAAK